jgi:hypothetical protein
LTSHAQQREQPDAAAALDDNALDAQVNEDSEVSFQLQSQG